MRAFVGRWGSISPSGRQSTTWLFTLILLGAIVCPGCVAPGPPPVPISEDRSHGVWVQFDRESGTGYNHPATLAPDRIAQALRGLWVINRDVIGGFDALSSGRSAPAFNDADVMFLAPLVSRALGKASPHDLVTFFLLRSEAGGQQLVTSGGLFLRGDHLHVMLANARSSLYGVQYENTYRLDARETPLIPIAARKFRAGFSPSESWIKNDQLRGTAEFRGYLDESKLVVIDLAKLPSP